MIVPAAEDIQLIVRLMRRDHEAVARLSASRRAPIETVADFAAAHGLAPVLLAALDGSPLRGAFSSSRLEALEERRAAQVARSRRLVAALEHLAEDLGAAGQNFLLLKGLYLAERFYGGIDGREFVDLDLLVPRADRKRAFDLLSRAGWARRSRVVVNTALTCFFVHGFDFIAGAAKLDLHWCLSRHPSVRVDEARVWLRRRSALVSGRAYDVLADEDEIVFGALSLLRDLERGRPKIKNIVDLVQMAAVLDATAAWEEMLETGRAEGTYGPMVNVLGACLDIAAASDLAPRLAAALARHGARRVPLRPGDSPLAPSPRLFHIGNKIWSARAHDCSPATWLLWWASSLPFRVAVHRRVRKRAPQPPAL